MLRLAIAALLGALVGAVVAAGVSLLAFTYPVQTEIANIPVDESGNLRVSGVIKTTIGVGPTGEAQGSIGDLVDWRDGPALQCVCSQTEYIAWPGSSTQLLLLSSVASQPRGR